ncbi:unnamed protein product, partial [Iphiclides podalirius]
MCRGVPSLDGAAAARRARRPLSARLPAQKEYSYAGRQPGTIELCSAIKPFVASRSFVPTPIVACRYRDIYGGQYKAADVSGLPRQLRS